MIKTQIQEERVIERYKKARLREAGMVRRGWERYELTAERQVRRRNETAKRQSASLIYDGPAVNLKFF